VLPIRFPDFPGIFGKGLLMGMADIIPGVSGGTMALITGIYERLIHGIRSVDFKFVGLALRGDRKGARENLRSIDYQLFVPLLLGIFLAVIILARLIEYLLDHQTAPTYGFFLGLILASAVFVYRYVERFSAKHIVSGLAGFIIVFLIVGLDELEGNHSLVVIFFAGVIAICAMILPGISGSLILLIMGQYHFMLDALNDRDLVVLAVFAVGAVIGIILFSRLLDHMIKNYKQMTMVFLFGLMLGALRVPVEKIADHTDFSTVPAVLIVGATAVLGFVLVFAVERRSGEIKAGRTTGTGGT
jgi:putative membrane protein